MVLNTTTSYHKYGTKHVYTQVYTKIYLNKQELSCVTITQTELH